MENDDQPIGRVLTRREVLSLLGLTGASLLAACAPEIASTNEPSSQDQATLASSQATEVPIAASPMPSCVVQPELTEGPYYVDADFDRSDIRSDPATGIVSEGAPLSLAILVSQVSDAGCLPLENAKVEIWHCDADGVYSGVSDPGFNTQNQKFLRGYQTTDASGQATFLTIYPGWYSGRCIHIHFKVHHDGSDASRVFTSQLFFDDTLSDDVLSQPPYNTRGQRNTLNAQDRIFDDQLVLNTVMDGDGYAATFHLGVQFA